MLMAQFTEYDNIIVYRKTFTVNQCLYDHITKTYSPTISPKHRKRYNIINSIDYNVEFKTNREILKKDTLMQLFKHLNKVSPGNIGDIVNDLKMIYINDIYILESVGDFIVGKFVDDIFFQDMYLQLLLALEKNSIYWQVEQIADNGSIQYVGIREMIIRKLQEIFEKKFCKEEPSLYDEYSDIQIINLLHAFGKCIMSKYIVAGTDIHHVIINRCLLFNNDDDSREMDELRLDLVISFLKGYNSKDLTIFYYQYFNQLPIPIRHSLMFELELNKHSPTKIKNTQDEIHGLKTSTDTKSTDTKSSDVYIYRASEIRARPKQKKVISAPTIPQVIEKEKSMDVNTIPSAEIDELDFGIIEQISYIFEEYNENRNIDDLKDEISNQQQVQFEYIVAGMVLSICRSNIVIHNKGKVWKMLSGIYKNDGDVDSIHNTLEQIKSHDWLIDYPKASKVIDDVDPSWIST